MTRVRQARQTSLARDATGGIFVRTAGFAVAYAATIVLARSLGTSDFGSYTFALSAVMLLSFPLHLGLPNLLVREVSIAAAEADWPTIAQLVRESNVLVIRGAVVVALAATAILLFAPEVPTDLGLIAISLLLVPIASLCAVRSAALRGMRMPAVGQLPDLVIRPAIVVALVGACATFGVALDASEAMIITTGSAVVGLVIGHLMLRQRIPVAEGVQTRVRIPKLAWLSFSLLAGATLINSSIGIIYLGLRVGEDETGLYRVAEQTASLAVFILAAVNLVIAPKIARMFFSGNKDALQRLLVAGAQISVLAAVPFCILFLVFGEQLLLHVFGSRFSAAGYALSILVIGHLVSAAAGSVALVLNMSGNERLTLYISIACAALNIILCVWLGALFGLMGVALSSAISTALWNVALAAAVWHKTGINCTAFGRFDRRAFMELQ